MFEETGDEVKSIPPGTGTQPSMACVAEPGSINPPRSGLESHGHRLGGIYEPAIRPVQGVVWAALATVTSGASTAASNGPTAMVQPPRLVALSAAGTTAPGETDPRSADSAPAHPADGWNGACGAGARLAGPEIVRQWLDLRPARPGRE